MEFEVDHLWRVGNYWLVFQENLFGEQTAEI
jgi:hypothetical protein